jgi:hypothetical protein
MNSNNILKLGITNLMSAIPWIGNDFVESINITELTLPTIGLISPHALKKGNKIRSDKSKFISIPNSFLAKLVGFIDGDGYILIHKTEKGYIKINLTISLDVRDLSLLHHIQSTLGIGIINTYPKTKNPDTCKLVINRTDLQEILFPLLIHHKLFFLTNTRREQYNKAMYILENNIKLFSEIPEVLPILNPLPKTAIGYTSIPFFNNWIVGFTVTRANFKIFLNQQDFIKLKFSIILHIKDIFTLNLIRDTLNVGSVKLLPDSNKVKYQVNKDEELKNKILPLFGEFPLLTTNFLDYHDFKKALILKNSKKNKSDILSEIKDIKNRMDERKNY